MTHNAVGGDDQVEAVRLLLSRLEHELRSPLQAVDGFAKLLRDRVPHDLRPLADHLCAGVAQLAGLVDELGRAGPVVDDQTGGAIAMGEVVYRLRAVTEHVGASRGVRLLVDCVEPSRRVPAALGATRLTQVLVNLVTNAMGAAPDQSVVHVQVQRRRAAWTFVVADEGPGVGRGDRQAIFLPFERRTTRPGSGLGLYIVKTLVEAAGGSVTVGPGTRNRGARFVVNVPDPVAT
jgi:signal transduction histidine kinase